MRVQIFSGTHAITCALFAVLRPGDEMLAISGPPYDTLEEVSSGPMVLFGSCKTRNLIHLGGWGVQGVADLTCLVLCATCLVNVRSYKR